MKFILNVALISYKGISPLHKTPYVEYVQLISIKFITPYTYIIKCKFITLLNGLFALNGTKFKANHILDFSYYDEQ